MKVADVVIIDDGRENGDVFKASGCPLICACTRNARNDHRCLRRKAAHLNSGKRANTCSANTRGPLLRNVPESQPCASAAARGKVICKRTARRDSEGRTSKQAAARFPQFNSTTGHHPAGNAHHEMSLAAKL
jgi:hypothetical protein